MKTMQIEPTTLFGIIIVTLTIVSALLTYNLYTTNEKLERAEKSLTRYNEKYLMKQGATSLYNGTMLNYNLASYDGGIKWYAFEYGDNWEVNILGEAEKTYPGLMKNLQAWDDLTEHVRKNGAIGEKPITPELAKIMKDAKLEIVTK